MMQVHVQPALTPRHHTAPPVPLKHRPPDCRRHRAAQVAPLRPGTHLQHLAVATRHLMDRVAHLVPLRMRLAAARAVFEHDPESLCARRLGQVRVPQEALGHQCQEGGIVQLLAVGTQLGTQGGDGVPNELVVGRLAHEGHPHPARTRLRVGLPLLRIASHRHLPHERLELPVGPTHRLVDPLGLVVRGDDLHQRPCLTPPQIAALNRGVQHRQVGKATPQPQGLADPLGLEIEHAQRVVEHRGEPELWRESSVTSEGVEVTVASLLFGPAGASSRG